MRLCYLPDVRGIYGRPLPVDGSADVRGGSGDDIIIVIITPLVATGVDMEAIRQIDNGGDAALRQTAA